MFDEELPVPYASLPAEAINSLSAKIVSVLFPLNDLPFYEIYLPALDPQDKNTEEVTTQLRRFERQTMDRIHASNLRSQMHTAANHLLVVGDVLLRQQDDFDFQLFRLDQYVVLRYGSGQWYEIITREAIDPDNLPDELENLPDSTGHAAATVAGGVGFDPARPDRKWLYSRIRRNGKNDYTFEREYGGTKFDRQQLRVSPYIPLRWRSMPNEHYGRSEVEDSFGDITALDSMTKDLQDGSALNAEYRWELDPFSMMTIDDFMDSVNGDVLPVRDGELRPSQFQNHSQIAATQSAMSVFSTSIGRRFLMNQAIQPEGERVTARQVSILAQEIESALGGMLSVAAREIQIPVVQNTMFLMSERGEIPTNIQNFLGDEDVLSIRIRAGLEVLKREADSERLNMVMDRVVNLPPGAQAVIRWPTAVRRWVISNNLDPAEIVKSDEELSAEQEAAAMQQQSNALQQQAQQVMQGRQ